MTPIKVKKPKSGKRLLRSFHLWPFNTDELATLEDILDKFTEDNTHKSPYESKHEAVESIRELIAESCKRIVPSQIDRLHVDMHPIVLHTAELFGVIAEEIIGQRRTERLSKARRYITRVLLEDGLSYREIAEVLNRDFTVIYRYINKREKNNVTDRSTTIDD